MQENNMDILPSQKSLLKQRVKESLIYLKNNDFPF